MPELLDPGTLSRISNYPLLARTVVEGFISGLHRSLYHGFGSEFVQYRHYMRGDDLKYLDWKVLARQDRLQIKVFQEETNTNCYLVLDCSASMAYQGQQGIAKLDYAAKVAAALAYLVTRQGDNVGLSAYNESLVTAVPPGHRSGQFHTICEELARLTPTGVCQHKQVFDQLGESFHRRGLVVLIGDFLDPDPALRKGINRLRFSHHDCVLLQILHQDEVDFPFEKTVHFVDSETGDEIVTAPEVVKRQYQSGLQEALDDLRGFCLANEIDHALLHTGEPLDAALATYLHRREQHRK